ncbi:MAG: hypothetical protein ACRDN8_25745 [Thermoleophilaceae bacterium]
MATEIEAARLLTWQSAALLDQRSHGLPEAVRIVRIAERRDAP